MTFFAAKFPPKRIIQTIQFYSQVGGGGSHLTAGPISKSTIYRYLWYVPIAAFAYFSRDVGLITII